MVHLASWLALIVCVLTCLIDQTYAQSSSTGGNIADVRIRRISGCTDIGDMTMDCPRDTTLILTMYGTGFEALDSKNFFVVMRDPNNPFLRSPVVRSVNASMITFSVRILRTDFWTESLQNVSLITTSPRTEITWFNGLGFVRPTPWAITGIDGCPIIDGLTGLQCDWTQPITLIGTGLSVFGATAALFRLSVGSSSVSVSPGVSQLFTLVDDSHLLFNVTGDGAVPLPAEARSGNPMSVSAVFPDASLFTIANISLGYSKFPKPVVSSIVASNCVAETNNGTTQFNECRFGYSLFYVDGKYMWDIQAFIGDQPVVAESTNKQVILRAPVSNYVPDMYHDITLINAMGTVAIPHAVRFLSTPQIAGWKPCVTKALMPITGLCLPGETFTILVANMQGRTSPPKVVMERLDWDPCVNPRIVDEFTVECTIGRDPDGPLRTASSWYLSWPDYNTTLAPERLHMWDTPDSPRIDQVAGSGCFQSADPSKPLQCLLDQTNQNATLSVHTTIFQPSDKQWYLWVWDLQKHSILRSLPVSVSSDNRTASAQLGDMMTIVTNKIYLVGLGDQNANNLISATSNVLQVQFVEQITYDVSPSKSSIIAITLGVVLPLVVLLTLLIVCYCYRMHKQRKPIFTSSSDSSQSDLELS